MEGVKMDVIKSGLYKGAGIAGTSLDDKQREMLQKEVEEIHADFKADVKAVREFADDSAMEGQTFSGKNAAAAGLVTGLVNGFDELMESLDAAVAEQMEADEKNDAAAAGGQPEESDEGASAKVRRLASARALAGVDLKALSAAAKMAEGEKEDEDKEKPESEDEDEKEPKSEDDKDDEKPESNDEEEGEDEEDEGEDAKSEDDPDQDKAAPQPKSDEDEKKDDEDAKERAEDEEGDADDAVDTDEKPDKSGVKRNRSKGVA
jgi:hypothetical protein